MTIKLKLIYFLLIISFVHASEKSVSYDTRYLPNQTILEKQEMKLDTFFNVQGNRDYINKLKEQGKVFPVNLKQQSISSSIIKSHNFTKKNILPFERKLLKHDLYLVNEIQKTKIPSAQDKLVNSTFYLSQFKNGKVILNKIDSTLLSEQEQKSYYKIFESMQENNEIKTVKLGESFIENTPLSFPFNGMQINFNQNTKYELISIDNNIAKFKLTSSYDLNTKEKNNTYKINIEGYGFGEIHYNTLTHINELTNSTTNITMKIQSKDILFIIKSNTDSKITNVLNP